ncbi:MAG: ROK family protein [Anaerolineales bacterium]|nr:ROK family protein [Anaerolineales bacterium]
MARSMFHTITSAEMRSVNRSAVLDHIRRNSPVARSAIAHNLKLSLPTVMRIVDELIAHGWVRPTGTKEWSSRRRRDLLEYYKDGHAVIGVDLGGTKMFGALANIGGEIIGEQTINGHGTSDAESYAMLEEIIGALMRVPRPRGQKIRGIAVGAPGVTRAHTGIVEWAPSLNWRAFPLQQKLAKRFRLPCIVDNDVNLAALGEQWFGAADGASNLVLIAIGTGVGAGLIVDGVLYRGHHEAAGEAGFLLSDRAELDQRYEKFGALESIISGTGIAERAQRSLAGKRSPEHLAHITSQDVFEAYRRREAWSIPLMDETIDYLSIAIVNISTLLDPELIILGGGVSESADVILPAVQARIQNILPQMPTLKVSTLGRRAAVMGAIAQIVHATSDYFVARKMI